MTKEQKIRRNRYTADFDRGGEEFILADLDLMLDEAEPDPVPLNPFLNDDDFIDRVPINTNDELGFAAGDSDITIVKDISLSDQFTDFNDLAHFEEIPKTEDAIDRLLVNTGFEANKKLEQTDKMPNTLELDEKCLADDITAPGNFIVEPVELTIQNWQFETEEISATDIHLVIDPDEIQEEKETIDKFLVNTVFDDNDELEEEDMMQGSLLIDNKDLVDDFPNFDQFAIESISEVEQNQQLEIAQLSAQHPQIMTGSDNILVEVKTTGRLFVDSGFEPCKKSNNDVGSRNALLIGDTSLDNNPGINFEKHTTMATDTDIFDSEGNELLRDKDKAYVILKKENISDTTNQQQAITGKNSQEDDLELINNKAGIVKMKSVKPEEEYIKKQIQDTENKVKKVSAIAYISLGFGIVAFLSLSVMGLLLSSMQTKVSKLTELVSILEEDMSSITEKNSGLENNSSNSSLERLNQRADDFSKQSDKQPHSSSVISDTGMTVDLKQSTVNKPLDKLQAKSSVSEKEKPLETVKKLSPKTRENIKQGIADWSVNLTAYEDLSYAKSKAAKYLQRGIPVKVIAVNMNNATWYRLKVGGFKNKEEATSYAAKLKKSLNLSSISVVNN